MSTLIAKKRPNNVGNGWEERHNKAIREGGKAFEAPIANMLRAWAAYAEDYKRKFGGPISEDWFGGSAWVQIGKNIRVLFNCELGRLDGGTLDTFYCEVLEENGFNDEGEVV